MNNKIYYTFKLKQGYNPFHNGGWINHNLQPSIDAMIEQQLDWMCGNFTEAKQALKPFVRNKND